MVAESCLDANLLGEVALGNLFVAVEGDQRSKAYRHGVGAQGQGLRCIGPVANAAGSDEAHFAIEAKFAKGLPGHDDGRYGWDPAVFDQDFGRGAGAGDHAVDYDRICPGFGR